MQDRGGSSLSASGLALVAPTPTNIAVLGVTDSYTLNTQVETVSAKVTGLNGQPVPQGSLTFTDGGQSQTAQLVNGVASATFTFQFGHEVPNSHPIDVGYTDPAGASSPAVPPRRRRPRPRTTSSRSRPTSSCCCS